jgi:hypothetical protein
MKTGELDLDRLLRLRLVVARYGEMDLLGWWNTNGVLGRLGSAVYSRGFPRTATFAQARVVFTVAAARCRELWNPPACATLWSLPGEIEEVFDDHWQTWADDVDSWMPFFDTLTTLRTGDLLETLLQLDAITPVEAELARDLRRSVDGRAVLLPGIRSIDDETLALLGAGFFRGEKGSLAIPYARLEG